MEIFSISTEITIVKLSCKCEVFSGDAEHPMMRFVDFPNHSIVREGCFLVITIPNLRPQARFVSREHHGSIGWALWYSTRHWNWIFRCGVADF